MFNKKLIVILSGFFALNTWIIFLAVTARNEQLNSKKYKGSGEVSKQIFETISFFKANKKSPQLHLEADYLDVISGRKMNFKAPRGVIYSRGNPINYKADVGFYELKKKNLELEGLVEISDKQSSYTSEKFSFDAQKEILRASGNVKSLINDLKTRDALEISSKRMISYLKRKITFLGGGVSGHIRRKRRYERGLDFNSEKMSFNYLESLILLDKEVKINKGPYKLTAGKAEIFLQNYNKKLKYYVLYDDVKLVEKVKLANGRKQIRRAFAEKLEAHQRSGKVVLTGAPKVEQGEDTIKGYQITLRENVELIEVDDAQSSFNLNKE